MQSMQRKRERNIRNSLIAFVAALVLFVSLLFTKVIVIDPVIVAQASGFILVASVVVYFLYLMFFTGQDISGTTQVSCACYIFSCFRDVLFRV